jgi:hypothetical protein
MVTVIGVKEGFVARLDEFNLIVQHMDEMMEMIKKGKPTDAQRTLVANIGIRTFWPNLTHRGYKSLRTFAASNPYAERAEFHERRYSVMLGKKPEIS